jgi:zinc and cadmium transporter
MSALGAIVFFSFVGGILSVIAAAGTLALRTHSVSRLIALAVGALLGAAFLEVLPHALEKGGSTEQVLMTVLVGILLFFLLEKFVLWRHVHPEESSSSGAAPAEHDHGRSGMMILVGDTFHNFVDGVLIAAAFLTNYQLGVVTALAIVAHEIPQEVGDFIVLLNSGYSKKQAFWFNLGSSAAMLVGGILGYYALATVSDWIPSILALAAASMLYVAVADLIPGLHRKAGLAATAQQFALIVLGIGLIAGVERLLSHWH